MTRFHGERLNGLPSELVFLSRKFLTQQDALIESKDIRFEKSVNCGWRMCVAIDSKKSAL